MFELTENNRISKENIESILSKEFFEAMFESKELLWLDDSLNGFFKECALVNKFLEKKL